MSFFNVLTMLGGLAFFLYGMDLMGNSLTRLSGNRLEAILEKLTTRRIHAVLLGLIVTALIQSSSGTTVMVVGLVNSGIMRLGQAIGVIMGANVGTTVTSWLLSLTGLEGDNFFLQMLKPSSFAPILALIGIIMMMTGKSQQKKNLAGVMIGFSILMFGMDTMSHAMAPLAKVPQFTRLFTVFSNPILGLLMGAGLTAIVQSSSASIGILQALCATGAVEFGAAVPIIMGQNIGTCITALLSAIGAGKNAKRAAYVHLLFNLIGTTLFMAVFYTLHAFLQFEFMSARADLVGIAIIHTSFNVLATIVLFPFAGALEKLACLIIRDKPDAPKRADREFKLLDPRFLEQPAFAVEQSHTMLVRMSNLCREALHKSIELINHYSEEGFLEVEKLENLIDEYEDHIGSYMVKISTVNLTDRDAKMLTIMMTCVDDFERISDHAMNLAQNAKTKAGYGRPFSNEAIAELMIYSEAIKEIVDLAIRVFDKMDRELATQVEPLEEAIDNINKRLGSRHIKRLQNGLCTIELGLSFSDILTNFERISDHCSNVAVSIIEINANSFDRHKYLTRVHEQHESFDAQYRAYNEKYALPKWDLIRESAEQELENRGQQREEGLSTEALS